MHHTKIVIRLLIGVWFLENTNEVVPKITKLEEIFDFIIIRHGLVLLDKQMGMENGLLEHLKSFCPQRFIYYSKSSVFQKT